MINSLPSLPEVLKIVSYNVAGFKPSVSAPPGWHPVPHFSRELLRNDPNVVCLQEAALGADFDQLLPGYFCCGSTPSHCENVMLFLKEEWASLSKVVTVEDGPAVLAQVDFSNHGPLVVGSCHLEPYKGNACVRLQQAQDILSSVADGVPLVLAGDFNMRQSEEKAVESNYGLHDAWKEAGSRKSEKFTWDSRDRTAYGGAYNKYHLDAFGFTCRFDRIYFRGDGLTVQDFRLIGNKPVTNPLHYLSDHFGMSAGLQVTKHVTDP